MELAEFLEARVEEAEIEMGRLLAFGFITSYMTIKPIVEIAKQAIQVYENWPMMVDRPVENTMFDDFDPHAVSYRITREIEWMARDAFRAKYGSEPPQQPLLLKIVNEFFSDHVDFQEEWRM